MLVICHRLKIKKKCMANNFRIEYLQDTIDQNQLLHQKKIAKKHNTNRHGKLRGTERGYRWYRIGSKRLCAMWLLKHTHVMHYLQTNKLQVQTHMKTKIAT